MDKKFDVKKLIQISLLIAIEVILTRFCSINTPIVRIGFGFLPIAIIAMMYGPLSAGISFLTMVFYIFYRYDVADMAEQGESVEVLYATAFIGLALVVGTRVLAVYKRKKEDGL